MLKIEIIGHLGSDVEMKDVNGKKFATTRVAHSEKLTDAQGLATERTTWVDITLFPDTPCLQYLKKGTQVFVRGNLQTRVYSSPKDKCMKVGLQVRAQEIQLLSSKKESNDNNTRNDTLQYDGF